MEEAVIRAEKRTGKGKGVSRKLRRSGEIPAVLYGKDIECIPITVSRREWELLTRHMRRNAILSMELHNNDVVENRPVMVKDIQKAFYRDNILHIDFLQVSMERTVEVEIPIYLIGDAKGVVENGIVEQHLMTIMVECLPGNIPEKIELDVTNLEIGDSIHVHEISIQGVKLLESGDVAVVTVIPPTGEEKPVVEEAEGEKKEE